MSKKISDLSAATTPLAGTELLEIVQGGASKKVAASAIGAAAARERLTASRTYYVRTDGSDSNNGLANTAGGAFLTAQKAVDTVYQSLDLAVYNVTVQVGDGTYGGAISCSGPLIGSGTLTIQGNAGTPTNVVLSTGATSTVTVQNGAILTVKDFKITNTANFGLYARTGGVIKFSGIDFGSVTAHQIRASDFGLIEAIGNYTISGGAASHWNVAQGQVRVQSRTITISGTPAYSGSFFGGSSCGVAIIGGCTFSGTGATGTRYSVATNSVCDTNSGGASYLPGNAAGSAATGGQYL